MVGRMWGKVGGTTLPSSHHHIRAWWAGSYTHVPTLCGLPLWDHLCSLPGGASGDLVEVAWCLPWWWWHLLPDHVVLIVLDWHFPQWWRGMQSVWVRCGHWRGADGVPMGSKHALRPYRAATFPFFPQCWRGFQRVGGQKWVWTFVWVRTTLQHWRGFDAHLERVYWGFQRCGLVTR